MTPEDPFVKILDTLNPGQLKAVTEIEGRIKVVAGAGSGKTRVLAARYAYLVEEVGVDPACILCMTFTNKAAQEMKTRIGAYIRNSAHVNDFVCTIHGFCVKVLRREIHRLGLPKNFLILDDEDAKQLARKAMAAIGLDRTDTTVRKYLDMVGACKTRMREGYVPMFANPQAIPDNEFGSFIRLQLQYFALDFDDLIHFTLHIINKFDDAREFWQNSIDYVEVDEVQDCNDSDWEIIRLVANRSGNLFIVGDPDQAIYEWRGARPDRFVQFQADSTIILDRNYRSTPQILESANTIIANNRNRIPKNLIPNRKSGEKVIHFHAKSEEEETEWIADVIKSTHERGASFSDFAILYRASHTSRAFEQALIKAEIPYTVWGGIRFFERREIKDAISYLRLVASDDDLAFERVINIPSRKFGEISLNRLRNIAAEKGVSLFEALASSLSRKEFAGKKPLRDFVTLISEFRTARFTLPISDILDGILEKSGLKKLYRDDGNEDRLENLTELIASIKQYEDRHRDDDILLDEYLQDIALFTNADYVKDDHKVRLMTIHQAKGLEFPYVFITGMTEGIFPSHRSIRERRKRGEEEERRLMYVGLTRGMKFVALTESEGHNYSAGTSKYPSRFLEEIGAENLETIGEIDPTLAEGTKRLVKEITNEISAPSPTLFMPGNKVTHKLFGNGIILENHPERSSCRVDFGNKIINLRYSALTPRHTITASES